MRNLQKILALVLALVMSLSLMATAGAREFTDGDQIDETFATSVDVLTGLDVFQGYPSGDFQPKGDITRAEVAAIIYRIATGDVDDTQVKIYADYNKFSDVPSDNWAAGYINYCANAEYIKGRGDGKFYPQDKVTGYEALAMILRVVGYDKNGEFTGADWQVQTAATANQRKVTKNVNAGTLGNPASRETVAELLCQAILIEKVNYTLAFGYQISTNPKETIGYETFHLEKLEGVVVANEYANFYGESTLAADRTNLKVGADTYTLNYGTTLDDMGESRIAYVTTNTEDSKNISTVLTIGDSGKNTTRYETTDRVSSISGNDFATVTGMRKEASTETYKNFGYEDAATADIRIRYVLTFASESARKDFEIDKGLIAKDAVTGARTGGLSGTVGMTKISADGVVPEEWEKVITPGTTLSSEDLMLIEWIFSNADKFNTNSYVRGEVYVGTASLHDVSDEISFSQFQTTYLKLKEEAVVSGNENGNWLKVVDNDDDGVAEYVMKVVYTMAQVVRVDENGVPTLDVAGLKNFDATDKLNHVSNQTMNANDEVAVGDIVYYAVIDGKAQIYKAEKVNKDIDIVDRTGLKVTTTDGAEYKQSGVHGNHVVSTDYISGVINMAGHVNYDMWLDRGGHLALFTRSAGAEYTLLTDGWYHTVVNGTEYKVRAYDGAAQVITDVNGNGRLFINGTNSNNAWGNLNASLSGTNTSADIKTTVVSLGSSGILTPVDWVYARNNYSSKVVRLIDTVDSIPRMNYATGTAYSTDVNADIAYNNGTEGTVSVCGTSNTVYYYVYKANTESGVNVETRTGWSNAYDVDAKYIEDVYAVATRQERSSDLTASGASKYYTADVVVVELKSDYRRVGEQVFITGDSISTSNVNIEQVKIIRENGTEATVDVDLSGNSNYIPSVGNYIRIQPGLYYMYPTTTENLYTIDKMTADDIAKNDYVVGQVVTSDYISPQNWVEVDPWYQPDAANTNLDENGRKIDPANDNVRKAVGENVYKLSYSYTEGWNGNGLNNWTVYNPTLTKYDGAKATLKDFIAERVDESDNATNREHHDGEYPYNRHWNNNDVLIKYNGGTAAYIISFANLTSNSGVNYAQTVWANCRPTATVVGTTSLSVGGKPFTPVNGVITGTVSYKELAENPIVAVNGIITDVDAGTIAPDKKSVTVTPNPSGATFRGSITGEDGNVYHYVLTQEAKTGVGFAILSTDRSKVLLSQNLVTGNGETIKVENPNALISDVVKMIIAHTGEITGWEAMSVGNTPIAESEFASLHFSGVRTLTVTGKDKDGIERKITLTNTTDPDHDVWPVIRTLTISGTAKDKVKVYTLWQDIDLPKVPATEKNGVADTYLIPDSSDVMIVVENANGDKVTNCGKVEFDYVSSNGHGGMTVAGNATNSVSPNKVYFAAAFQNIGNANLEISVDWVGAAPGVNKDASITVTKKAGTSGKFDDSAAPNYTVTVPFGSNMTTVMANWQQWVTVTDNTFTIGGSRVDTVRGNVVTLKLEGVGTGKDAIATITFKVDDKVNGVDDERYDSAYEAAGIKVNVVENADGSLTANITGNRTELQNWLDKNTTPKADGSGYNFSSALQDISRNNKLFWGISVAYPAGATQVTYEYGSGGSGTTNLDGSNTSNNRYQDWMKLGTFNTTTGKWDLETTAEDWTSVIFKDAGGNELARAKWTFNVNFS